MLIKLVLVLFFGALLLLASADVLLNFARSSVAENITRSALTLLLSAFALLMLTAIIKSSHYLIGQVRHFFLHHNACNDGYFSLPINKHNSQN